MEDLYRFLGLSPLAGKAAVRKAFHEQIKIWHPDRFAHDRRLHSEAEERTRKLIFAYESIMLQLTKNEFAAASKIPSWDDESVPPRFGTASDRTGRPAHARPRPPTSAAWGSREKSDTGGIAERLATAIRRLFGA